MFPRPVRMRLLSVLLLLGVPATALRAQSDISDDFSAGLAKWTTHGTGVRIVDSGDPAHGKVMVLSPNGDVHALLRGTHSWPGVRLEADFFFTDSVDAYLGLVTNFRNRGGRMDFGNVYLKSPDGYLQANPHLDYNVTRTFYPEFQAMPDSGRRTAVRRWGHIAFEAIGGVVHVYVNRSPVPDMVFPFNPVATGAVGFQPRSVGSDVWIDNVVARPITRFSDSGRVTQVAYQPERYLTKWELAGPFPRTRDAIARDSSQSPWRSFATDARGAVPTSTVVDYHGPNSVAYFRTAIESDRERSATLNVSTVEDIAVWVNGRFAWFVTRTPSAWFDAATNERHAGRRFPIALKAGTNTIVFRVRGGTYAAGGFFARLE